MRNRKQKYLIHTSFTGQKETRRDTESSRTRAFVELKRILQDAPVGSVGAVYLRNNPDAPLDDNDVDRIGCHYYKGNNGVTRLPHKRSI